MYIAIGTRSDIAHAVNSLSQFNCKHGMVHWQAAKRVLRYLTGTLNKKLTFSKNENGIQGFADADWGNCIIDRSSYTGYVFTLCGGAVSWCLKKQRTVALSSTEAEYMALSEAGKECLFLYTFFQEIGLWKSPKISIFSAMALVKNPVFQSRTKHIDIRYHFIRRILKDGKFKLNYIATEEMIADILTKGLTTLKHEYFVKKLGLRN